MIIDLAKMKEATAQAVREICNKFDGPCVGMCLLFLVINDEGEREWYLSPHLVGDAQNPLDEEARERIKESMKYVMGNAALIFEGADVDPGKGGSN